MFYRQLQQENSEQLQNLASRVQNWKTKRKVYDRTLNDFTSGPPGDLLKHFPQTPLMKPRATGNDYKNAGNFESSESEIYETTGRQKHETEYGTVAKQTVLPSGRKQSTGVTFASDVKGDKGKRIFSGNATLLKKSASMSDLQTQISDVPQRVWNGGISCTSRTSDAQAQIFQVNKDAGCQVGVRVIPKAIDLSRVEVGNLGLEVQNRRETSNLGLRVGQVLCPVAVGTTLDLYEGPGIEVLGLNDVDSLNLKLGNNVARATAQIENGRKKLRARDVQSQMSTQPEAMLEPGIRNYLLSKQRETETPASEVQTQIGIRTKTASVQAVAAMEVVDIPTTGPKRKISQGATTTLRILPDSEQSTVEWIDDGPETSDVMTQISCLLHTRGIHSDLSTYLSDYQERKKQGTNTSDLMTQISTTAHDGKKPSNHRAQTLFTSDSSTQVSSRLVPTEVVVGQIKTKRMELSLANPQKAAGLKLPVDSLVCPADMRFTSELYEGSDFVLAEYNGTLQVSTADGSVVVGAIQPETQDTLTQISSGIKAKAAVVLNTNCVNTEKDKATLGEVVASSKYVSRLELVPMELSVRKPLKTEFNSSDRSTPIMPHCDTSDTQTQITHLESNAHQKATPESLCSNDIQTQVVHFPTNGNSQCTECRRNNSDLQTQIDTFIGTQDRMPRPFHREHACSVVADVGTQMQGQEMIEETFGISVKSRMQHFEAHEPNRRVSTDVEGKKFKSPRPHSSSASHGPGDKMGGETVDAGMQVAIELTPTEIQISRCDIENMQLEFVEVGDGQIGNEETKKILMKSMACPAKMKIKTRLVDGSGVHFVGVKDAKTIAFSVNSSRPLERAEGSTSLELNSESDIGKDFQSTVFFEHPINQRHDKLLTQNTYLRLVPQVTKELIGSSTTSTQIMKCTIDAASQVGVRLVPCAIAVAPMTLKNIEVVNETRPKHVDEQSIDAAAILYPADVQLTSALFENGSGVEILPLAQVKTIGLNQESGETYIRYDASEALSCSQKKSVDMQTTAGEMCTSETEKQQLLPASIVLKTAQFDGQRRGPHTASQSFVASLLTESRQDADLTLRAKIVPSRSDAAYSCEGASIAQIGFITREQETQTASLEEPKAKEKKYIQSVNTPPQNIKTTSAGVQVGTKLIPTSVEVSEIPVGNLDIELKSKKSKSSEGYSVNSLVCPSKIQMSTELCEDSGIQICSMEDSKEVLISLQEYSTSPVAVTPKPATSEYSTKSRSVVGGWWNNIVRAPSQETTSMRNTVIHLPPRGVTATSASLLSQKCNLSLQAEAVLEPRTSTASTQALLSQSNNALLKLVKTDSNTTAQPQSATSKDYKENVDFSMQVGTKLVPQTVEVKKIQLENIEVVMMDARSRAKANVDVSAILCSSGIQYVEELTNSRGIQVVPVDGSQEFSIQHGDRKFTTVSIGGGRRDTQEGSIAGLRKITSRYGSASNVASFDSRQTNFHDDATEDLSKYESTLRVKHEEFSIDQNLRSLTSTPSRRSRHLKDAQSQVGATLIPTHIAMQKFDLDVTSLDASKRDIETGSVLCPTEVNLATVLCEDAKGISVVPVPTVDTFEVVCSEARYDAKIKNSDKNNHKRINLQEQTTSSRMSERGSITIELGRSALVQGQSSIISEKVTETTSVNGRRTNVVSQAVQIGTLLVPTKICMDKIDVENLSVRVPSTEMRESGIEVSAILTSSAVEMTPVLTSHRGIQIANMKDIEEIGIQLEDDVYVANVEQLRDSQRSSGEYSAGTPMRQRRTSSTSRKRGRLTVDIPLYKSRNLRTMSEYAEGLIGQSKSLRSLVTELSTPSNLRLTAATSSCPTRVPLDQPHLGSINERTIGQGHKGAFESPSVTPKPKWIDESSQVGLKLVPQTVEVKSIKMQNMVAQLPGKKMDDAVEINAMLCTQPTEYNQVLTEDLGVSVLQIEDANEMEISHAGTRFQTTVDSRRNLQNMSINGAKRNILDVSAHDSNAPISLDPATRNVDTQDSDFQTQLRVRYAKSTGSIPQVQENFHENRSQIRKCNQTTQVGAVLVPTELTMQKMSLDVRGISGDAARSIGSSSILCPKDMRVSTVLSECPGVQISNVQGVPDLNIQLGDANYTADITTTSVGSPACISLREQSIIRARNFQTASVALCRPSPAIGSVSGTWRSLDKRHVAQSTQAGTLLVPTMVTMEKVRVNNLEVEVPFNITRSAEVNVSAVLASSATEFTPILTSASGIQVIPLTEVDDVAIQQDGRIFIGTAHTKPAGERALGSFGKPRALGDGTLQRQTHVLPITGECTTSYSRGLLSQSTDLRNLHEVLSTGDAVVNLRVAEAAINRAYSRPALLKPSSSGDLIAPQNETLVSSMPHTPKERKSKEVQVGLRLIPQSIEVRSIKMENVDVEMTGIGNRENKFVEARALLCSSGITYNEILGETRGVSVLQIEDTNEMEISHAGTRFQTNVDSTRSSMPGSTSNAKQAKARTLQMSPLSISSNEEAEFNARFALCRSDFTSGRNLCRCGAIHGNHEMPSVNATTQVGAVFIPQELSMQRMKLDASNADIHKFTGSSPSQIQTVLCPTDMQLTTVLGDMSGVRLASVQSDFLVDYENARYTTKLTRQTGESQSCIQLLQKSAFLNPRRSLMEVSLCKPQLENSALGSHDAFNQGKRVITTASQVGTLLVPTSVCMDKIGVQNLSLDIPVRGIDTKDVKISAIVTTTATQMEPVLTDFSGIQLLDVKDAKDFGIHLHDKIYVGSVVAQSSKHTASAFCHEGDYNEGTAGGNPIETISVSFHGVKQAERAEIGLEQSGVHKDFSTPASHHVDSASSANFEALNSRQATVIKGDLRRDVLTQRPMVDMITEETQVGTVLVPMQIELRQMKLDTSEITSLPLGAQPTVFCPRDVRLKSILTEGCGVHVAEVGEVSEFGVQYEHNYYTAEVTEGDVGSISSMHLKRRIASHEAIKSTDTINVCTSRQFSSHSDRKGRPVASAGYFDSHAENRVSVSVQVGTLLVPTKVHMGRVNVDNLEIEVPLKTSRNAEVNVSAVLMSTATEMEPVLTTSSGIQLLSMNEIQEVGIEHDNKLIIANVSKPAVQIQEGSVVAGRTAHTIEVPVHSDDSGRTNMSAQNLMAQSRDLARLQEALIDGSTEPRLRISTEPRGTSYSRPGLLYTEQAISPHATPSIFSCPPIATTRVDASSQVGVQMVPQTFEVKSIKLENMEVVSRQQTAGVSALLCSTGIQYNPKLTESCGVQMQDLDSAECVSIQYGKDIFHANWSSRRNMLEADIGTTLRVCHTEQTCGRHTNEVAFGTPSQGPYIPGAQSISMQRNPNPSGGAPSMTNAEYAGGTYHVASGSVMRRRRTESDIDDGAAVGFPAFVTHAVSTETHQEPAAFIGAAGNWINTSCQHCGRRRKEGEFQGRGGSQIRVEREPNVNHADSREVSVQVGIQLQPKSITLDRVSIENMMLEVKDEKMSENLEFPVGAAFYPANIEMETTLTERGGIELQEIDTVTEIVVDHQDPKVVADVYFPPLKKLIGSFEHMATMGQASVTSVPPQKATASSIDKKKLVLKTATVILPRSASKMRERSSVCATMTIRTPETLPRIVGSGRNTIMRVNIAKTTTASEKKEDSTFSCPCGRQYATSQFENRPLSVPCNVCGSRGANATRNYDGGGVSVEGSSVVRNGVFGQWTGEGQRHIEGAVHSEFPPKHLIGTRGRNVGIQFTAAAGPSEDQNGETIVMFECVADEEYRQQMPDYVATPVVEMQLSNQTSKVQMGTQCSTIHRETLAVVQSNQLSKEKTTAISVTKRSLEHAVFDHRDADMNAISLEGSGPRLRSLSVDSRANGHLCSTCQHKVNVQKANFQGSSTHPLESMITIQRGSDEDLHIGSISTSASKGLSQRQSFFLSGLSSARSSGRLATTGAERCSMCCGPINSGDLTTSIRSSASSLLEVGTVVHDDAKEIAEVYTSSRNIVTEGNTACIPRITDNIYSRLKDNRIIQAVIADYEKTIGSQAYIEAKEVAEAASRMDPYAPQETLYDRFKENVLVQKVVKSYEASKGREYQDIPLDIRREIKQIGEVVASIDKDQGFSNMPKRTLYTELKGNSIIKRVCREYESEKIEKRLDLLPQSEAEEVAAAIANAHILAEMESRTPSVFRSLKDTRFIQRLIADYETQKHAPMQLIRMDSERVASVPLPQTRKSRNPRGSREQPLSSSISSDEDECRRPRWSPLRGGEEVARCDVSCSALICPESWDKKVQVNLKSLL